MLKLTNRDREGLIMACNCIRNCKVYKVAPAPYFPLLIRMYKELEEAGLIEFGEGQDSEVPPYV